MSQPPTRHYTSAGGVVITADGLRVLVLRRPGRQGPDDRPEVRLPKGHVEAGESLHQAARREVQEEAGLAAAEIVASLGHQRVEFDLEAVHVIRDEHYYLMAVPAGTLPQGAEAQFEPLWLSWEDALRQLSFEAEREWLRRARATVGPE
jgi:8-oxo-dGTP pyrophosphatase MutT (NUDIX family)